MEEIFGLSTPPQVPARGRHRAQAPCTPLRRGLIDVRVFHPLSVSLLCTCCVHLLCEFRWSVGRVRSLDVSSNIL
jgi:hypothetical protein